MDKSNAGTLWEKWLGRLENLFVGMKVTDGDHCCFTMLVKKFMTSTTWKKGNGSDV